MDSAQATQFKDSLIGRQVAGWKIEGFFGYGKSAVVFRAHKDGMFGALKIFHPELIERHGKQTQLQRILREKQLVGAVHPNLVRIFDGGECVDTGHLFIVMEPLAARNLHQVLIDIPANVISRLIGQVASAARFLEDRGLVHRDIKPENIAISDDYQTATLLDLGVLRPIGIADLTDVDERPFIGTLRYSAPEFLIRKEEDTREGWRAVTFYQLGAVLHDLIMRTVLFSEHTEPYARLVQAVSNVNPLVEGENGKCVRLAKNCLVKNPKVRNALVHWDHFSLLDDRSEKNFADLQESIRQRQAFTRSIQNTISLSDAELARTRRQNLLLVCNRLESRIAAIINDHECFPLREIRSESDESQSCCKTRIDFECDEDKGLKFKLCILFEIQLVGENDSVSVFVAKSSALLASGEAASTDFTQPIKFISGDLSTLLDSTELTKQFFAALEAAYETQDRGHNPMPGKPIPLTFKASLNE
jgi:eukaryotic-like serine/threonine-protein kinase